MMDTEKIRQDIPEYGIDDDLVFRLLDEIDRLNGGQGIELDAYVELQKHRDHWRGYAYGKRGKPRDFLDGNMSPRPETKIEALREINRKLLEAIAVVSRDHAPGCTCHWHTTLASITP